ncbi:MAG: ABC transporter ATP-binding protein [Lachnospiraceae bacterium]|nr:ABC transporter ATP-binding protein [Lachnospiraceae bacterium]MBR4174159.1 ABC transporter ATP-binding protein [Lachnospiraceae bacterium]
MSENIKKREEVKLVSVPSPYLVPERNAGKGLVLEANHLGIDFGGLTAVDDFNLGISPNEITGLIGPNGAGKTTVFNLLTKVYQQSRGTIFLDGKDTMGMSATQVNKAGIARTFQNIRLFDKLTVEDNVKIGLHNSINYGMWQGVFRLPIYWKEEKKAHDRVLELLSIFDMADMADMPAGSLPYGAQRRLEIVRALATEPKVLLLDEPAAGMNPSETAELMENIGKIRDEFGIAILLIEHDMNLVMGICEGIVVLNFGKIIAKGTPSEIQNNPVVVEAYLGKSHDEETADQGDDTEAGKTVDTDKGGSSRNADAGKKADAGKGKNRKKGGRR